MYTCNGKCLNCCSNINTHYRAVIAWESIKQRAGNKRKKYRTYGKVELSIDKADFIAWFRLSYTIFRMEFPTERPSVDRIDNGGHYELSNLQMISHRENSGKNKRTRQTEDKTVWRCSRCRKLKHEREFSIDKRWNAPQGYCRECRRNMRQLQ